MEIYAGEVARFLFGNHGGYALEEDQQKEREWATKKYQGKKKIKELLYVTKEC